MISGRAEEIGADARATLARDRETEVDNQTRRILDGADQIQNARINDGPPGRRKPGDDAPNGPKRPRPDDDGDEEPDRPRDRP